MNEGERKICQYVIDDGEVIDKKEFDSEGTHIEQFVVLLEGEEYHITKHDGEYVYFFHATH